MQRLDFTTAISAGIFAINTLQHPDASSDEDVAALDVESESALAALVELRRFVDLGRYDDTTLYEKCALCHFFIERNDSYDHEDPLGKDYAVYVHHDRGDEADEHYHNIVNPHNATPSGMKATLSTWRVFGPEAMRERFVPEAS